MTRIVLVVKLTVNGLHTGGLKPMSSIPFHSLFRRDLNILLKPDGESLTDGLQSLNGLNYHENALLQRQNK